MRIANITKSKILFCSLAFLLISSASYAKSESQKMQNMIIENGVYEITGFYKLEKGNPIMVLWEKSKSEITIKLDGNQKFPYMKAPIPAKAKLKINNITKTSFGKKEGTLLEPLEFLPFTTKENIKFVSRDNK